MRIILLVLIQLFIGTYINAQQEHKILLEKDFSERVTYIDSVLRGIPQDSSYRLYTYESIKTLAEENNDSKLAMHIEILLYQYYLIVCNKAGDSNCDSICNDFLFLIKSARDNHYDLLYPYSLFVFTSYLHANGQINMAFEYRLKAYDAFISLPIEKYPFKNASLLAVGQSFYQLRDYHSAKNCFKKISTQQLLNNEHFIAINNIGLCFRNLNILDSAMHYFKVLYRLSVDSSKNEWKLISILNIGQTHFLAGNVDSTEAYMLEAYKYAHQHDFKFGVLESTNMLAKIALKQKDYTKAKSYAQEGVKVYYDNKYWYHFYWVESQSLYETLARIHKAEGNYEQAYLYMDSLLLVIDSANSNRRLILATAIESKSRLMQNKYLQEKQNVKITIAKNIQMRNGIIIGIVLFAIISILFINRQNIKRRQLETERKYFKVELASSKEKLANYTERLKEKNKMIDKFSEELELYNTGANVEHLTNTIKELKESAILTDSDWEHFKNMFEQVHSGYLYRLKTKLPNLTPGETRIVLLCKLKLTTKEMATILGVGTSTIRKYKFQLRNKLNLSEGTDINKLIDTI